MVFNKRKEEDEEDREEIDDDYFQPETSHSRRVFGHQIVARKSAPIGNECATTFILFLKLDIPPRESESGERFPPPASGREPV